MFHFSFPQTSIDSCIHWFIRWRLAYRKLRHSFCSPLIVRASFIHHFFASFHVIIYDCLPSALRLFFDCSRFSREKQVNDSIHNMNEFCCWCSRSLFFSVCQNVVRHRTIKQRQTGVGSVWLAGMEWTKFHSALATSCFRGTPAIDGGRHVGVRWDMAASTLLNYGIRREMEAELKKKQLNFICNTHRSRTAHVIFCAVHFVL